VVKQVAHLSMTRCGKCMWSAAFDGGISWAKAASGVSGTGYPMLEYDVRYVCNRCSTCSLMDWVSYVGKCVVFYVGILLANVWYSMSA
jgi:hypothetical protein